MRSFRRARIERTGLHEVLERIGQLYAVEEQARLKSVLLLLALFGIIALLAAPCAIANVTAGRVLVQRQDIAMLKALGFTPGQVVRMLLAEQTLLGAAGAESPDVDSDFDAFLRDSDG